MRHHGLHGALEYTKCISPDVQDSPNECPGCDTKQPNGETQVMLELWGIWSTPSLSLLPAPLWSGLVAPDKVLSMTQMEPFDVLIVWKQMTNTKLDYLK